jgi:SAM-dependent methyltransferase
VSEMWDSVAEAWDRNAEIVDEHMAAATAVLLDAAGVAEGASVLELATGPGGAGIAAADLVGAGGRVVLADVAPGMIAVAARRAAGRPQVETAVFDQSAIDAPDGTFDAVISRHGLMFAEDPVAAVREGVRVLRPGGAFAAMTWGPRADNPWLALVLDAVGQQFGVPFPPPQIRGPFSLDDRTELSAALLDGGLDDVRVETIPTPMGAASLEAWWERATQLAGPLAQALAGMEPEVREAIHVRAVQAGQAHARTAGDGIELDGSVLIASGRRSA